MIPRLGLGGWALVLACTAAETASAQGPSAQDTNPKDTVQAELHCAPRVGKGRVLCDADVTVKSGRLTWADAIITKAPNFAPPLRDRIGMHEASERDATHLRLPFALIAQDTGEGEVTIKARTVWCKAIANSNPERELCVTVAHTVTTAVVVTQESHSTAPKPAPSNSAAN